ncbi:hypothetical protein [Streptomyces luteireticuli]|uniref:hypothetical protein n=1 Tax=Streptomyces luteireticuli TaxID=173858 RepID=UPI003557A7B8
MYGPGFEPGQPQPHRPGRAMVVTIRVIVVAVTVCSLCILSWVPMLRIAIVRRRAQDWGLFWGTLFGSFGLFAWAGTAPKDSAWSNVAVGALLILGTLTVTAYLMADIRHQKELDARRFPVGPAFAAPGHGYPPAPAAGAYPPPHAQQPYGGGTVIAAAQPNPYMNPPEATRFAPPPPVATPPAMARPEPPYISPPPDEPGRQTVAHRSPERIRQVRAELDELSDLLRKDAGEKGEGGR